MSTRGEVSDALCGVLKEGSDVHRCFAAHALGRIGDHTAVPALVQGLLDDDEDVRVDAAEALGILGDQRAVQPLIENLIGDPCTDVKANAIEALARLDGRAAIPVLRQLVTGHDDTIAWDDTDLINGGWDDWLDVQVKALGALADLGASEAVPDIVRAMNDEMGQDLSGDALKALARLGSDGVNAVSAYLSSQDERYCRGAVRALADVVSPEADDALLGRALAHSSADIRLLALHGVALRHADDVRVGALLHDVDPTVRAGAAALVGHCHPKTLDRLLDDESDKVQTTVLELFATDQSVLAPPDLPTRLRQKLVSGNEPVAAYAVRALAAREGKEALPDLERVLLDRERPLAARRAAAFALADSDHPSAVSALRGAVEDDERQLRLDTMAGLARVATNGSLAARETLLAALRGVLIPEPEQEVEPESAPLNGQTDDTKSDSIPINGTPESDGATSTLEEILARNRAVAPRSQGTDTNARPTSLAGDLRLDEEAQAYLALADAMPRKRRMPLTPDIAPHQDVRRFAARLLGDVTGQDSVEALSAALGDQDMAVRCAAADSLARLFENGCAATGRTGAALAAALGDSDRDVRLNATRALAAAGDTAAQQALENCLSDKDELVRIAAVRALSELGAVGPEVVALLEQDDPGLRVAAAEAVASAADASALDKLLAFAFSFGGMHRREAARHMRRLDAQAASARFLEILHDPGRKRLWRVAIEALEELHRPESPVAGASVQSSRSQT